MSRQAVTYWLDTAGQRRSIQLQLDPTQGTQNAMLIQLSQGQPYEPRTSMLIATCLREGDTFVDVGAHVGYFSVFAAVLVGATGRVFSFEPEQENYQHLLENVELNGLPQVRAFNSAVAERPGSTQLYVNRDNDGGHALWDVGHHPAHERSRVEPSAQAVTVTSLDEALSEVDPAAVRLIKIDTEGAELGVLQGSHRLLSQGQPFLICEINPFGLKQMGTSEQELRGYLESLGYRAYDFVGGRRELAPVPADQLVGDADVANLVFRKGPS